MVECKHSCCHEHLDIVKPGLERRSAEFHAAVSLVLWVETELTGLPAKPWRNVYHRNDVKLANIQARRCAWVGCIDGGGRFGHPETDVVVVGFTSLAIWCVADKNGVSGKDWQADIAAGASCLGNDFGGKNALRSKKDKGKQQTRM